MKYIIYELLYYGEDTIIREIDGFSRFDDEKYAIERINEVRSDKWQEFTIMKVYKGKEEECTEK